MEIVYEAFIGKHSAASMNSPTSNVEETPLSTKESPYKLPIEQAKKKERKIKTLGTLLSRNATKRLRNEVRQKSILCSCRCGSAERRICKGHLTLANLSYDCLRDSPSGIPRKPLPTKVTKCCQPECSRNVPQMTEEITLQKRFGCLSVIRRENKVLEVITSCRNPKT